MMEPINYKIKSQASTFNLQTRVIWKIGLHFKTPDCMGKVNIVGASAWINIFSYPFVILKRRKYPYIFATGGCLGRKKRLDS